MSKNCTYVLRVSTSFLGHSHTVSIKLLITVLQNYASFLISKMQSVEYLEYFQIIKQCQRPEDEKEIMYVEALYSTEFPEMYKNIALFDGSYVSPPFSSVTCGANVIPPMLCTHFRYDFTFEGYKEFTFVGLYTRVG